MLDTVTLENKIQAIKDAIPTVKTPEEFNVLKESIQALVKSSLDLQK